MTVMNASPAEQAALDARADHAAVGGAPTIAGTEPHIVETRRAGG